MTARTFLVALAVFVLVVAFGANALAQSGSGGWFDIETNFRVWQDAEVRDDLAVTDDVTVGGALTVVESVTAADLAATDDLTVGDDAAVTGSVTAADVTTTGDVTAGDDLTLADWLDITSGTPATVTVTAGSTITPTATWQPITAAGNLTTSTSDAVADGSSLGQLLILYNSHATSVITIDGTGGNVECGADVALSTTDSITLVWNGADWVCIGSRDNNP